MTNFKFSIHTIGFDDNYQPANNTRITTNFANLARGERRQQNLRKTLAMINQRFNSLVFWDNPLSSRYSLQLDIISVAIQVEGDSANNHQQFPAIEVVKTTILDHKTGQSIPILCSFRNLSAALSEKTCDLPERIRQQNLSAHQQPASVVGCGVPAQ